MNRRQSDHLMMIIISLTILIIILTYFIEINSVVHGQGVITTKDNAQLIWSSIQYVDYGVRSLLLMRGYDG
ncbi:hypothetical protein D3W76_23530 [Salmonella enterica]|nr:hypothetical protein [Salmonella enterica]